MSAYGAIDAPLSGAIVAREGFIVEGFAFDDVAGPFARISVRHNDVEVGASAVRLLRPDVGTAIPAVWDMACGFRLTAAIEAAGARDVPLTVRAEFSNGAHIDETRMISIGAADYRSADYGGLLTAVPIVMHRSDMYGVGPPSAAASSDCVALLAADLAPGETVIDVGCGVGAYGPPLLAAGVHWQGCEINPGFVERMRAAGLPVTAVENGTLPFADGAFESAMCIEVLEHIEAFDAFIAEIRRVTRKRAYFSVPNAEAIPVLADQLVVPWHMLEGDHKNFFNRSNLRTILSPHFRNVEVVPYGPMPLLSSNRAPVYYHLFATAEV